LPAIGNQVSGLPLEDTRYLAFAAAFEATYLDQGEQRRTLRDTLEVGWRLLDPFPGAELKRLTIGELAQYHLPTKAARRSSTTDGDDQLTSGTR
jgi:vacuolar-type H+-ATPase subunit B/Vma2